MIPGKRLFRSFWIAGFECSCQLNSAGVRLDMTAALQHDVLCGGGLPPAAGGRDRDGAGRLALAPDRPRRRVRLVVMDPDAGGGARRRHPGDLGLVPLRLAGRSRIFSPAFVDRFARFAREAARIHREHTDDSCVLLAGERDLVFRVGGYAGSDVSVRPRERRRAEAAAGARGAGCDGRHLVRGSGSADGISGAADP